MRQDASFQFPKLRGGIESELLGEALPRPSVDLECCSLPARSVERDHQLTDKPLASGFLCDEGFQFGDECGTFASGEIRFHAFLDDLETSLIETFGLTLREGFEAKVGECRSTPNRKRLGIPAASNRFLEPIEIELALPDMQLVARPVAGDSFVPKQLAQARDV